jgi:MoaA/NifB/PqqE/SkfB family radical SAM enzyme
MENMDKKTFELTVEQLKEFPQQFKCIYYVGLGEPLLHPRLPEMTKIIKASNITREISLYTNAVNLTNKISLDLINAGLDFIYISVNGLNDNEYERNCGRSIDFNRFIDQIAFLYAHKGNMRIFIKTTDLCINGETDRKFFFDTFGNICDFINIETICTLHTGVDYSGDNIKDTQRRSRHPSINAIRNVCSFPFLRLSISSSGKVSFCDPVYGFPYDNLDVHKQRLINMWNGSIHKQLMLNLLRGINEGPSKICDNCNGRHACAFEEDNLDPYSEELYKRISEGIVK